MLQVIHDGAKYICRMSMHERNRVQRMGFQWCKESQRWFTHDPRIAYRVLECCVPHVRDQILEALNLRTESKSPLIPVPRHLVPFNHQIHAVNWVLTRPQSYLALDAGLGKTPIAALVKNVDDGPMIVICPPFLKYNWEDELDRWLVKFNKIQIIKGQKSVLDPDADIYIMPDSLLHVHAVRDQFFKLGRKFKYLFIDEAHRYKNPDAKRTQSLIGGNVKVGSKKVKWSGFHKLAERTICLSGTPIPNRPIEIHPVLYKFAPHAVNFFDRYRFGVEFCNGHETEWGWDFNGASNLSDLHTVLTRNYMMVRKIEECLDLPALTTEVVFLENDAPSSLKKQELALMSDISIDEIIALECQTNDAFMTRKQTRDELAAMNGRNTSAFSHISDLRKELGLAKVPQCVSVIKDMLETNDKIVVFAWHKEVVDLLKLGLSKFDPKVITGDVANHKRHEIVKEFQSDSKCRVLIANIQAAGVGITLTASSRVVFVEPSYVPSDNGQAISRCHRATQTRPVVATFLVCKNSLDHRIINAHINKLDITKQIIKKG